MTYKLYLLAVTERISTNNDNKPVPW